MYPDDLEPDQWQDLVHRSVWLHLAKLDASGLTLGTTATNRLVELSNAYPLLQLAANESDEFSDWMSGTGDPGYESNRDVDIAPRKRQELVQWLTKPPPERRPFHEDTWRDICRTRFFHSLYALCDLARDDVWPADRWREALQTWAQEGMALRSWRYAAPLLETIPDAVLQEIDRTLAWWIAAASKSINCHEEVFMDLCRRLLALPPHTDAVTTRNGKPIDQPVNKAINHPVGLVTQALINLWLKEIPSDNALLPADIKPIFTMLCDVHVDQFRHARVLLSSRLITIFRVDRLWTQEHLLPLFSWSNPDEAKAVWQGFLWSPRLYQPLLAALKPHFLECADHYADLGEFSQQFAALLTYAALELIEGYTVDELRSAVKVLPIEGLEKSAQTFSQAMEAAADQREDYWKNRAYPFWQQIWPKSCKLVTPRMAEFLTQLAIAARGEFPAALTAVQGWLIPIKYPQYILQLLHKSGLCSRFPTEALRLLDAVINEHSWISSELDQCLGEISHSSLTLAQEASYIRLNEHFRKRCG
jgi:hypothetical protein